MERPDRAREEAAIEGPKRDDEPWEIRIPIGRFFEEEKEDRKTLEDLPHDFLMVSTSAFGEGNASHYKKHCLEVKSLSTTEMVYIGDKGSEHSRVGEVLVLRCYQGVWTAWDSSLGPNGQKWNCRQAAFRLSKRNEQSSVFPRPGEYVWDVNSGASKIDGSPDCWELDALTFEVREPR